MADTAPVANAPWLVDVGIFAAYFAGNNVYLYSTSNKTALLPQSHQTGGTRGPPSQFHEPKAYDKTGCKQPNRLADSESLLQAQAQYSPSFGVLGRKPIIASESRLFRLLALVCTAPVWRSFFSSASYPACE
ncbi:hypothetical protein NM208_g14675 [Fusarium decemcellulare]|uniref:Uncharacterized protein n=1 Tax=Fusarium decemcellulare TaxID=57161 RepID=A0ACC1RJE6_9HYPO|nr:hypothetical protein NM208_g14675 [Fusarium decemcellulare]